MFHLKDTLHLNSMIKRSFSWWLGLFIAIATALATYLSSCSTSTKFSINADTIANPNIHFSDSTNFQKFW